MSGMKETAVRFVNGFVKVTGWIPQRIVFNTRFHYEDQSVQNRRIHGPAILITNHTSIYDYAAMIFAFPGRTLRYQMAEVLFGQQPLGTFLKLMGGIRVDRNAYDMGFVTESLDLLEKGGVVGIFPESRLPKPGEERPLPFKTSAAYIALAANVPVIPVYTNGAYFGKKRAEIVIGTPMNAADYTDEHLSDKENLERVTEAMRNRVIELGKKLNEEA